MHAVAGGPRVAGRALAGYDAGYYGYLWSQALGDDMYTRFEETSPLDQE